MKRVKLELKEQPCSHSCLSACLAMLTGQDVVKVRDEFHEGHMQSSVLHNPFVYVTAAGFGAKLPSPFGHYIYWEHVTLLSVPSINIPKVMHAVVFDGRDSNNPKLYDPSTKKKYEVEDFVDPEIECSWHTTFFIPAEHYE